MAVPVQNKKELKSAEWCLHWDTYSTDDCGLYYDLLPYETLTRNMICVWVEKEVLFAHVDSLDSMKLTG